MRRAGVYKRPYVLRAYFDTNMIIAESKGKISHPHLQFLRGHKVILKLDIQPTKEPYHQI